MKYKLDKELLKAIRESNNETIKIDITDNKIELVEDDEEWSIEDIYYYVFFNLKTMLHYVASSYITQEKHIKQIKKEKSFKRYHTEKEAQEYADWLNIRAIVEETIDELGRPTKEEVEGENKLYYVYPTKTFLKNPWFKSSWDTYNYAQPFLCKKPFLDELIGKIGEIRVCFFYENLWRFL